MWSANMCAVATQHNGGSHQLIDIHNFCPLTLNTRYGMICLHVTHVWKPRLDALKGEQFQRRFLVAIKG